MSEITRVSVDTSKSVFTYHAVDDHHRLVRRGNLRRQQVVAFFQALPPVEVALEACGGSHHWARTLQAMGHRVRLIPPQYVKPFVKRGKNDRNDAEAISEASLRPGMACVPVKSAGQQAAALLLSVRELLVGQRTQLVNALRGHVEPRGSPDAAEFGLVAPVGDKGLAHLRAEAAQGAAPAQAAAEGTAPGAASAAAPEAALPALAAEGLARLGAEIDRLDARLAVADAKLLAQHKASPMSQLLAQVPGIGPVGALTLALRVDAGQFQSGRHLAAWLGLTPRDHSTGGKQRLGGISRAGNERLRQLLVLGATTVIQHAKPSGRASSAWLLGLLARKPRKVAAVALANKMARIAWAKLAKVPSDRLRSVGMPAEGMMTSGEGYREPKAAAA